MNKFYTLLLALFATILSAQIPQGFSYQAVAFTSAGSPVVNGNVSIKISILDNSASGTNLYTETHSKTTNSKGLVNLNIGQGTALYGTFSAINWTVNPKFLKVEIDAAGGSNYTSVGTNQLMTVPYAMVAGNVNLTSNSTLNDDIIENKSSNFAFVESYTKKVYAFNNKTGTWNSQPYLSAATPELKNSNGNFIFVDAYVKKIYVYNSKTGIWNSQSYLSAATPDVQLSNGNFIFIDAYTKKVYIFSDKTGTWSSQSYLSAATPGIQLSNGNLIFIDEYTKKFMCLVIKQGFGFLNHIFPLQLQK